MEGRQRILYKATHMARTIAQVKWVALLDSMVALVYPCWCASTSLFLDVPKEQGLLGKFCADAMG